MENNGLQVDVMIIAKGHKGCGKFRTLNAIKDLLIADNGDKIKIEGPKPLFSNEEEKVLFVKGPINVIHREEKAIFRASRLEYNLEIANNKIRDLENQIDALLRLLVKVHI